MRTMEPWKRIKNAVTAGDSKTMLSAGTCILITADGVSRVEPMPFAPFLESVTVSQNGLVPRVFRRHYGPIVPTFVESPPATADRSTGLVLKRRPMVQAKSLLAPQQAVKSQLQLRDRAVVSPALTGQDVSAYVKPTTPSDEGLKRYEFGGGFYEGEPCTCTPECPEPCHGYEREPCKGCEACAAAYGDYLSMPES